MGSLNVSVANAVLLYEAQRQRHAAGCYDHSHLDPEVSRIKLFEWLYPGIAAWCRARGRPYPPLDEEGEMSHDFRAGPPGDDPEAAPQS